MRADHIEPISLAVRREMQAWTADEFNAYFSRAETAIGTNMVMRSVTFGSVSDDYPLDPLTSVLNATETRWFSVVCIYQTNAAIDRDRSLTAYLRQTVDRNSTGIQGTGHTVRAV